MPSLFFTWIFWVAGAAAMTQTLGGGLNCAYVFSDRSHALVDLSKPEPKRHSFTAIS